MAKKLTRDERLLALIKEHPGLDALALKKVGWRAQVHGQLRDAERRGLIVYLLDGWFVTVKGFELLGILPWPHEVIND